MSTSSWRRKPATPIHMRRSKAVWAVMCGEGIYDVRWTMNTARVTCDECKARFR